MKKKKYKLLHIALFSILGFINNLSADNFSIAVNQPGLVILEASIDSVWVTQLENGNEIISTKPALLRTVREGYPELPYYHTLLTGIPASAKVQLFFGELKSFRLTHPAITPVEQAKGLDGHLSMDKSINNGVYKAKYSWKSAGSIDGVPIQSIEVYPVLLSEDNLLTVYKQVTVRIQWNSSIASSENVGFLNQFKRKKSRVVKLGRTTSNIPEYQYSKNLVKLVVDTSGWFSLDKSTLLDSGVVLMNVDPKTFRLWYRGEEQLLWVEGENDGKFNKGDFILFYAERNPGVTDTFLFDNYTYNNCYWLTWGSDSGLRYAEESGYPALPKGQTLHYSEFPYTLHIERKETFRRLGNVGTHQTWDTFDHFFMLPIINGGRNSEFEISIPNPGLNDPQYSLAIRFQAITESTHNISIFMNNYKITDGKWSGRSALTILGESDKKQDKGQLRNGRNTVSVFLEEDINTELPGLVFLDWIELSYKKRYTAVNDQIEFTRGGTVDFIYQFEINGFESSDIYLFKNRVSRIRDFITVYDNESESYMIIFQDWIESDEIKYTAFSDIALLSTKDVREYSPLQNALMSGGSNYLIITPEEFVPDLEPLSEYYNAAIVTTDSIYRRFNDGVLSPYAIKEFLTAVYRNWNPVPENVLLVGVPYIEPTDEINLPAMFYNSYKWGSTVTDYWYALIDGDDYVPEFHIGRFPAANSEELQVMVEKTLAYISDKTPGIWENRFLMIGGYEKRFKEQSEIMIESIVGEGFFADRLYIDSYSEGGPYFGNTDTLLNKVNKGLSIINFFGHGGGAIWGDRSLLTLDDIDLLTNGNKLPFITSMTCFTGDISNKGALGRELLTYSEGGSIVFFGSSGIGWIENDFMLIQPIYQNLLSGEELTVGRIIDYGKLSYYAQYLNYGLLDQRDIVKSLPYQYNLLGDPALKIRFPIQTPISVDPIDPQPSEKISINIDDFKPDTVFLQLFDINNEPIHRNPKLLFRSDNSYTWIIPESLSSGSYSLNVSFVENGEVHHESIHLEISGSAAYIISILPEAPSHRDSLRVRAYIKDGQGIKSVTAYLDRGDIYSLNMVSVGDNIFETKNSFPPQSPGKTLSFWLEVVDGNGDSTKSKVYDITIPVLPNFTASNIQFDVSETIQMVGEVRNLTKGLGIVDVTLEKEESPGNWNKIDSDTLTFEGHGIRQVVFDPIFLMGVWSYRLVVNADSSIDETSYSDNIFTKEYETSSFLVTPELGSSSDMITHSRIGIDGISIEILPGTVTSAFPVTINKIKEISLDYQPKLNPTSFTLDYAGFQLEYSAVTDSFDVEWTWNDTIPANGNLYQWYSAYQTWLKCKYDSLNSTKTTMYFKTNTSTKFAYLISDDIKSPQIEATVNGIRFIKNSYISSNPRISVVVEDDNGVDPRLDAINVFKNGTPYETILDIPKSLPPNVMTIQFTPELSTLDTTIGIMVKDASGNMSDTLSLLFIVKNELEVIDYGNYPNPFKDRTIFTYELTDHVDEFSLEVFSVAGQKIKTFNDQNVLSDLGLSTMGYHEIFWNGKDDKGDFIDNGVYFYRVRISKGKTVLEKFGKLAKGR